MSKVWITWIKLLLTHVQARLVSQMGPSDCCITISNKNIYSAKEAFVEVFQHLIRACCSQTKMFASEQSSDSDQMLFICPAKKPIYQWSFHRKCVAFDPQPQQNMYEREHQILPILCLLILEGPTWPMMSLA